MFSQSSLQVISYTFVICVSRKTFEYVKEIHDFVSATCLPAGRVSPPALDVILTSKKPRLLPDAEAF